MGNFIRGIFRRISNFFNLFLMFYRGKHPKTDRKDEKQAQEIIMSRQDQLLSQQFGKTIEQKVKIEHKTQHDYCEIAFAYANLAMIHAQYGSQDYQRHMKSALSIYNPLINHYYEQTITLLNNVALALEKHGQKEEADRLYGDALRLCERYYPIADERTLVVRNNMALAREEHGEVRLGSNMIYAVQKDAGMPENVMDDSLNTVTQSNLSYYYSQDASNQMNQSLSNTRVADIY